MQWYVQPFCCEHAVSPVHTFSLSLQSLTSSSHVHNSAAQMFLQWQAVVLLLFGIYSNYASSAGDYESLGLAIFFAYMWVQDFTMMLLLRRVTRMNLVSIFGMHLLAFLAVLGVQFFTSFRSFIDYGSLSNAIKAPTFWLSHLLITVACIVPVEAVRYWRAAYVDTFTNNLYRGDSAGEKAYGTVKAASVGGFGAAFNNNAVEYISAYTRSSLAASGGGATAEAMAAAHPLLAVERNTAAATNFQMSHSAVPGSTMPSSPSNGPSGTRRGTGYPTSFVASPIRQARGGAAGVHVSSRAGISAVEGVPGIELSPSSTWSAVRPISTPAVKSWQGRHSALSVDDAAAAASLSRADTVQTVANPLQASSRR